MVAQEGVNVSVEDRREKLQQRAGHRCAGLACRPWILGVMQLEVKIHCVHASDRLAFRHWKTPFCISLNTAAPAGLEEQAQKVTQVVQAATLQQLQSSGGNGFVQCSAMVLMKLGDELLEEFLQVTVHGSSGREAQLFWAIVKVVAWRSCRWSTTWGTSRSFKWL